MDNNNQNINNYKTIEQIVKIGKAATKPVSVRLNVSTIEYFEKNAKKYNTKTGTIISDILDDYVENLKKIEYRQHIEVESSLMNLCRHLTEEHSEDFFLHYIIDKTREENSIIEPSQNYGGESIESVFHRTDFDTSDDQLKIIKDSLEETRQFGTESVANINGDPENEPAIFCGTPKDLFVKIYGVIIAPYDIDRMYSPDWSYGDGSIFIVPTEDWAFITSILIETASIKTRQLNREINMYRLTNALLESYNGLKDKYEAKKPEKNNTPKYETTAYLRFRVLAHNMARYEDLPSNYEFPKDLDNEENE